MDLFRAERHGACQLALSSELREELVRTAKTASRSDPMHTWATTFITFPAPSPGDQAELLKGLREIVFPNRTNVAQFSANDYSDLKHLAAAAYHRVAGFITNDGRILDAASALYMRYGIRVLSPLAFQEVAQSAHREESYETPNVASISVTNVIEDDEPEIRSFLTGLGVPDTEILTTWAAVDSSKRTTARWAVWSNKQLLGFLACPAHVNGTQAIARLAVDQRSDLSREVAFALLYRLVSHLGDIAPVSVRLEVPSHQAKAREVATLLGFVRSSDGRVLSKIVLNRILTADNWSGCRNALWEACRLRLPAAPPVLKSVYDPIELIRLDGNRVFVPLFQLETNLAPALFCVPGRRAVITPIQRRYAEHLLEHSDQGSLLPKARANLFSEKHYVSAARTLKLFSRGTVILFYESGKHRGASAVIALGRVQRAYLKPAEAIGRMDLDPSVLDDRTLRAIGSSKSKTITAFDNVMLLPKVVPLTKLQQLGCGNASQLISTRAITTAQLQGILAHGIVNA